MEGLKRIIGLEIANSSIKLVYGNEDNRELYYLNTVEEIEESKLNDIMKIDIDNVYEYGKKKYRIANPKATGSGGISDFRYESESFKRECAFALTQIVKTPNEKFYIVTGLPSSEYYDDDKIAKLKKNLKDSYKVTHKGITREFEIADIIVIPQPLGTLLNYFFTKDLKEKINEEDMKHDYLIFDVGWGTLDCCVVNYESGVTKNKTIDEAMLRVVNDIMEAVNKKYAAYNIYRFLTTIQLDQQLQKTTKIQIGYNKPLETKDIIEEIHKRYATMIYQRLLSLNYRFAEYKKIIFTGGGSVAMKKALEEQFSKECECEFVDNSVMANARGFYILAKQNF